MGFEGSLSEFQDRQCYIGKPCLVKTEQTKTKQGHKATNGLVYGSAASNTQVDRGSITTPCLLNISNQTLELKPS